MPMAFSARNSRREVMRCMVWSQGQEPVKSPFVVARFLGFQWKSGFTGEGPHERGHYERGRRSVNVEEFVGGQQHLAQVGQDLLRDADPVGQVAGTLLKLGKLAVDEIDGDAKFLAGRRA